MENILIFLITSIFSFLFCSVRFHYLWLYRGNGEWQEMQSRGQVLQHRGFPLLLEASTMHGSDLFIFRAENVPCWHCLYVPKRHCKTTAHYCFLPVKVFAVFWTLRAYKTSACQPRDHFLKLSALLSKSIPICCIFECLDSPNVVFLIIEILIVKGQTKSIKTNQFTFKKMC